MSEMVERVRKAIEAHCYEVGFQLKPAAGNRLARAAIEAMREPTHAMSREFFIAWTMAERRGFDFPESPVVYAWNRMIDAMLDDGTSAALGEGE